MTKLLLRLLLFTLVHPVVFGATLDRSTWKVTASRNWIASCRAVDGFSDSDWNTGGNAQVGDFLMIDMRHPQTLDAVQLTAAEGPDPLGWTLMASVDNSSWSLLASNDSSWPLGPVEISLAQPASFRYLLLNVTKGHWYWWFSVAEISASLGGTEPPPEACTSPAQMTRHAGFCAVLNGASGYNNSMANLAVTLEHVTTGQNYSFLCSSAGVHLCALIDILWSNPSLADQYNVDLALASSYAATMRRMVLAIARLVNNGLGGSGYQDSVTQFAYSLDLVGVAWEVIDRHPDLGQQVTGDQRAEVFKMFLKVLSVYTNSSYSNGGGGSFGAYFHHGATHVINSIVSEVNSNPNNSYVTAAQAQYLLNFTAQYSWNMLAYPWPPNATAGQGDKVPAIQRNNATGLWSTSSLPNGGGHGPSIPSDS
jgi:hypothetical protein